MVVLNGPFTPYVMQEHHQQQASMGHTPTHFGHMMNCLKTFEDGCTKRKFNS
jgi:hypothetical protein